MKKFKDYIGKGEFEVYVINRTSLKTEKRKIEIKRDGALIDSKSSQVVIHFTLWMALLCFLNSNKAFGYFIEEKDAKFELWKYMKTKKETLEKKLKELE
jgi:hypothetical protein